MSFIKISNKYVGENFKPFIIAEAGINHNGSVKKALKMVKLLKSARLMQLNFKLIAQMSL